MIWKFKQIKPMKARGVFKDSMWSDPNYLAEEKYDGDRRIAQFCASGLVRYTGTRESVDGSGFVEKTENLPHLMEARNQARNGHAPRYTLEGTVLDGEMIPPHGTKIVGGGSKYVTSIMGSLPSEALRKQRERGYLCYVVFDCLWHKGLDLSRSPLMTRRDHARQAIEEWGNSYVSLAAQDRGVDKRIFYDRIVRDGGEGVVLKHVSGRYGDQNTWIKVKAEATADVVVMGFEPGKGKYEGVIGAIRFGQYRYRCGKLTLDLVGTCSGFDDALRRLLTANGKRFVGRVLEIRHNGREPTGAFRHPRFSRWREDKDPYDCTWNLEES